MDLCQNQKEFRRTVAPYLANMQKGEVLAIKGTTGCGKYTIVPELVHQQYPEDNIAVTQPRIIAATSLAQHLKAQGMPAGFITGDNHDVTKRTEIVYMTQAILTKKPGKKWALDIDQSTILICAQSKPVFPWQKNNIDKQIPSDIYFK